MGADKSTDTNDDWFPTYEANVYELSQCFDGVFRYQVLTPDCKVLKVCLIYTKDKEKKQKKLRETFLEHKDPRRVDDFIMSLSHHADFTKQGINTSHFWVRWLCWNKETLEQSIIDIEQQFGIKIRVKGRIDFIRCQVCPHQKNCV